MTLVDLINWINNNEKFSLAVVETAYSILIEYIDTEDLDHTELGNCAHNLMEILCRDVMQNASIADYALKLLLRLDMIAYQEMTNTTQWACSVFVALANDSKAVRTQAYTLLKKYQGFLKEDQQMNQFVTKAIKNKFGDKLKELYHNDKEFVMNTWLLIIYLAGKELMGIAEHMLLLLKDISILLVNAKWLVRAWQSLLDTLYTNEGIDGVAEARCLDGLLTFLTNYESTTEDTTISKILMWWYLVTILGSNISSLSSKVVHPLLEFCAKSVQDTYTSDTPRNEGKKISISVEGRKVILDVIDHILETECKTGCAVFEMDPESHRIILKPLLENVFPDFQSLTSKMLNIFDLFLSSGDNDVNSKCLVALSQKLCQQVRKSNSRQLYTLFLNCFNQLVDMKIVIDDHLLTVLVSISFTLKNSLSLLEIQCSENLLKNEETKLAFDALVILMNIFTTCFSRKRTYDFVTLFMNHYSSDFIRLFRLPPKLKVAFPSFTVKLTGLWQKLSDCLSNVYGDSNHQKDLEMLLPLMECTMQHPHSTIKTLAMELWESMFGQLSLESLPEYLRIMINKTQIPLLVSSFAKPCSNVSPPKPSTAEPKGDTDKIFPPKTSANKVSPPKTSVAEPKGAIDKVSPFNTIAAEPQVIKWTLRKRKQNSVPAGRYQKVKY